MKTLDHINDIAKEIVRHIISMLNNMYTKDHIEYSDIAKAIVSQCDAGLLEHVECSGLAQMVEDVLNENASWSVKKEILKEVDRYVIGLTTTWLDPEKASKILYKIY